MLIYRLQLAGPNTSIGTDFRNANQKDNKIRHYDSDNHVAGAIVLPVHLKNTIHR